MTTDIWHYPKNELAQQVLGMFENGLSSALVFFALRRMGKIEFLIKDMQPLAKKRGWNISSILAFLMQVQIQKKLLR